MDSVTSKNDVQKKNQYKNKICAGIRTVFDQVDVNKESFYDWIWFDKITLRTLWTSDRLRDLVVCFLLCVWKSCFYENMTRICKTRSYLRVFLVKLKPLLKFYMIFFAFVHFIKYKTFVVRLTKSTTPTHTDCVLQWVLWFSSFL